MKKGLSLCGGGSRGSYELGAWQAFRELNLTFDVVTGTSIGALNGLMIVQDDYKNAEKLWSNVDIKKVVGNGIDFEELNVKGILQNDQFLGFVKQIVKDKGTDIQPFKDMVKEYLSSEKIKKNKIEYGVVVTQFPLLSKEEVKINDLSEEDMFNYIVASASCFPAFPICKFNNKQYIDGGYLDNLPIEFAFKLGATEVLAIDLNHNITHKEYLNSPLVTYIYPKWDLGSILYFEKNTLDRNRKLGYYDTLKQFGKYDGIRYTFKKDKYNVNLAKEIATTIVNDAIYLNNKKMLSIAKKDLNNVFTYLNKHIKNQVTFDDYFIKCIESLLFYLEYDPTNVYVPNNVIKEIFKLFEEIDEEIKINYEALTTDYKRKDYIEKTNKKKMLSYIFNIGIDYELKMFIFQSNIELYLAITLLEISKNYKFK